jgi:hypothetical protein
MAMASIIRQQSFFVGEFFTAVSSDLNASAKKPGSQSTEEDHFLISDGFGNGIMERTYW